MAGTLVVLDTFTRANSTSVIGSAETGQAWTVVSGTWGVIDGQAYTSADSNAGTVTQNPGLADARVSVDFTSPDYATIKPTLLLRYIDTSNHLQVDMLDNAVRLFKRDGGSLTSLASVARTNAAAQSYAVRVDARGAVISVFVDGAQAFAYTLEGADLTKFGTQAVVGLRTIRDTGQVTTGIRFDNFRVTR